MSGRLSLLAAAVALTALAVGTHSVAMTPPPPDSIDNCGFPAIWSGALPGGPLAGKPATVVIHPGHGWSTTAAGVTISSTWAVESGQLVLTDLGSVPAPVACKRGQRGTYAVDFTPDCSAFTMKAVSDPCPGRKATLHGLTLKRASASR